MKILLDCDGILADFTGATLDMLKRIGIGEYTPEQVTQYSIFAALELSKEQKLMALQQWRRPGFCSTIEPYADAKKHIESLRALGDIVVVTTPLEGSRQWAWERKLWLKHHFGLTSVISTDEKQHIAGDVMIDDMPEHLSASICKKKILFARPWNEGKGPSGSFSRVGGWPALIDVVGLHAARKVAA